jgi:hypothetical protein
VGVGDGGFSLPLIVRIISGLCCEKGEIDDCLSLRYIKVDLIQVFGLREISYAGTLGTCTYLKSFSGALGGRIVIRVCYQEAQTYLKHQHRTLQQKEVFLISATMAPQTSSIGSLHAQHMQSTASLPSAWSTYVIPYVSGVSRRCWHDAAVRTGRVCTHELSAVARDLLYYIEMLAVAY